jgi:hypothetical protein
MVVVVEPPGGQEEQGGRPEEHLLGEEYLEGLVGQELAGQQSPLETQPVRELRVPLEQVDVV